MADETDDWGKAAEARILNAALAHAAILGWNSRLISAAARNAGFTVPEAELLLPNGARDLAALMSRKHDREALDRLADVDPMSLKIRERIRVAVFARVDAAVSDEPATRGWAGFLALPTNIWLGLRLAWESADVLWHWAGDTATDENHYSKRVLLAEILISTLAIRLAGGAEAAEVHLDRRIAGVMSFEKWKARLKLGDVASRAGGVLGRIRFGSARV